MKILVLDDNEQRHESFAQRFSRDCDVTHVRTVTEALEALRDKSYDLVYLDHDLEDYQQSGMYGSSVELTGLDVARFIARMPEVVGQPPTRVVVHSWNPAGARAMVSTLREAGIPTTYEPFQDIIKQDISVQIS